MYECAPCQRVASLFAGAEEHQLEQQRKHKERLKEKEERAEVLRVENEAKRKACQERVRVQHAEVERRKLEEKRRQEEALAVCFPPAVPPMVVPEVFERCMLVRDWQAKRKALADDEARRKDKRLADEPFRKQNVDDAATQIKDVNQSLAAGHGRADGTGPAPLPDGWREFTDPATQRE